MSPPCVLHAPQGPLGRLDTPRREGLHPLPRELHLLAPAGGGVLQHLEALRSLGRLCLQHPQRTSIFFLNLLLGWTGLGWIGSLCWAVCHFRQTPA